MLGRPGIESNMPGLDIAEVRNRDVTGRPGAESDLPGVDIAEVRNRDEPGRPGVENASELCSNVPGRSVTDLGARDVPGADCSGVHGLTVGCSNSRGVYGHPGGLMVGWVRQMQTAVVCMS